MGGGVCGAWRAGLGVPQAEARDVVLHIPVGHPQTLPTCAGILLIHACRERTIQKFNFDIRAVVEDARKRQHQSGHKVVSRPPKRPTITK